MARHLVFVIGTRAQLIKVAPVVVACEQAGLPTTLLMTGQHRETMQDLIDEFALSSPQVSATPAKEHATIFSLLRWLPSAYRGIHQRLSKLVATSGSVSVLVHGDTLSTFIGALAARRANAEVVHLESGLTSGRLLDPFPEELLRRLVFRMTQFAMCPQAQAAAHMRRYCRRVLDTGGNTIVDAVRLTGAADTSISGAPPYLVASLHRFQNIYNARRLRDLVSLIEQVSKKFVVHFVLHPATRSRLAKEGLLEQMESHPRITLSPRMGYGKFLRLAAGAQCVLTDGGSNQEELAVLGVPTIVMRARTERPDGLGANALMEVDVPGTIEAFILSGDVETLRRPVSMPQDEGPSARIVQALQAERT